VIVKTNRIKILENQAIQNMCINTAMNTQLALQVRITAPNISSGHLPHLIPHPIPTPYMPMYHQHPHLPYMNFQSHILPQHLVHPYTYVPHSAPMYNHAPHTVPLQNFVPHHVPEYNHIPSHGHNPQHIPARTIPQHNPTHNHIPQYEPTQSHVPHHVPANNRVPQQVSSYNSVYTTNTQYPQGSANEATNRSIQSMHNQQIQPNAKINSIHGETQQSASTSTSNGQKNSEFVKTIHTEQCEIENIPTYVDDCQIVNISTKNSEPSTLNSQPNEETAEKQASFENQTPNDLFRQMGLNTKPPEDVQHNIDMLSMEKRRLI